MTTGWHNVKILHDKVKARVHYYLDNQYLGEAITKEDTACITLEKRKLTKLEINTNGANLSSNEMLVDNIKMSYLDTVMPNGTVLGEMTEPMTKTVASTDAGNGGMDIIPANSSTIKAGRDYIYSADIQISNPVFNGVRFYAQNSSGNLLLSGKIANDNTSVAFYKNSAPWLDNASANDNNYVHVFDMFPFRN